MPGDPIEKDPPKKWQIMTRTAVAYLVADGNDMGEYLENARIGNNGQAVV